jgi:hypothetical protein
MPDPQINPPDASQSPAAQQWQQKQQQDPSKFRLSGLIGSMASPSGKPNIAGGLGYALSPEQREMFGNTQATGVQQSRTGLTQSSAVNDYLKAHYGDLSSTNPDMAVAIAHAHGAGSQAALQATQTQAAGRQEAGQSSAERQYIIKNQGVSPYTKELESGLQRGAGEAQGATSAGQLSALKATEAGTSMAATGKMPETATQRQEIAQRGEIAKGQLGLGQEELGEKKAEFPQDVKAKLLQAFAGYGGMLPLMYDQKGGIKPEFMNMMDSIVGSLSGGAGQPKPGGPQTMGVEDTLEREMQAAKSGGQAKPTAPTGKGSGPGAGGLSSLVNQKGPPTETSQPSGGYNPAAWMQQQIGKAVPYAAGSEKRDQFNQIQSALSGTPLAHNNDLIQKLSLMPPLQARQMIQQLMQRNK